MKCEYDNVVDDDMGIFTSYTNDDSLIQYVHRKPKDLSFSN